MTELHKNSFCSCFLNEAHCLSQSCNKYETCLWVNRTHSLQQHYDDKLATNTPHSHNNQEIIMTDYMIFKQWLEMPCLSSQMSLNPQSSSKSLLCSAEESKSYRCGTTWGWENDNRIFISGWTIPLTRWQMLHKMYTSVSVLSISSQQVNFNNPKSVNEEKVIFFVEDDITIGTNKIPLWSHYCLHFAKSLFYDKQRLGKNVNILAFLKTAKASSKIVVFVFALNYSILTPWHCALWWSPRFQWEGVSVYITRL